MQWNSVDRLNDIRALLSTLYLRVKRPAVASTPPPPPPANAGPAPAPSTQVDLAWTAIDRVVASVCDQALKYRRTYAAEFVLAKFVQFSLFIIFFYSWFLQLFGKTISLSKCTENQSF